MSHLPRQYRQTRLPAPGPHPDWSEVEWHVYHSPKGHRVTAKPLPEKSKRTGERFVGSVKRCSLKTVRKLLTDGVPARLIQAKVDSFADAQTIRTFERKAERVPRTVREDRARGPRS